VFHPSARATSVHTVGIVLVYCVASFLCSVHFSVSSVQFSHPRRRPAHSAPPIVVVPIRVHIGRIVAVRRARVSGIVVPITAAETGAVLRLCPDPQTHRRHLATFQSDQKALPKRDTSLFSRSIRTGRTTDRVGNPRFGSRTVIRPRRKHGLLFSHDSVFFIQPPSILPISARFLTQKHHELRLMHRLSHARRRRYLN
jgi:hypothetical protein